MNHITNAIAADISLADDLATVVCVDTGDGLALYIIGLTITLDNEDAQTRHDAVCAAAYMMGFTEDGRGLDEQGGEYLNFSIAA